MVRKGDLISFSSFGWHKGFYNVDDVDDITDALLKIRYTDFFEYPDDEEFPYDSAQSHLRGSCNHFAVALKNVLGYTPYIIEKTDKKGFHAFCQVYKNGRLYYVDARGVTSSFDEFMIVAREFVRGEYTIREATQDVIEEWERGSEYNEEAYAFSEAVIRKYIECYTV